MLGVIGVHAGLLTTLVAVVCLVRPLAVLGVRTRKAAVGVAGVGLGVVAGGMILPAGVQRAPERASLIDEWMPQWQFGEFHSLRMHTTVERAWHAVHAVTGREIRLLRTLTWIRHPRWPWSDGGPATMLDPEWDTPIFEVATAGGFHVLATSEDSAAVREIVLGTAVVWNEEGEEEAGRGPEWIRALQGRPGNAVAAINFRVHDEGGGWVRVTTETRVYGTDASSRQRFARYWRVIYPGSWLLRHTWLRAIRVRAGAATAPPAGVSGVARS